MNIENKNLEFERKPKGDEAHINIKMTLWGNTSTQ